MIHVGANFNKITLARSDVELMIGHHYADCNVLIDLAEVHHFKWHRGVLKDVMQKKAIHTQQGHSWARTEYPRTLAFIQSRLQLEDLCLNVRPAAKLGI